MRIALDLRIYGPRFGGLGRYNEKLLEGLIKYDSANQYYILIKNPNELPKLPANFQAIGCNIHWYTLKEQLKLPKILQRLKPDLVHFPHFNVPYFYREKFVVTIHDLIMTKFPSRRASTLNWILFNFKWWAYRRVIKHAVVKAQAVIAVSKFTKDDIISYFNLPAEDAGKIKVIYEGITLPSIYPSIEVKLPSKYFLYVGNAYPHKNLEFLIKTFNEFAKTQPDYKLILVGNNNYFYQRLQAETKKIIAADNQVIFAGYVPDLYLTNYYRQATAYIFPSLYEGFGLPPLEAMAYGLPVLASNASCLPEILGPAALYFNPRSQNDLLAAMNLIIKDQNLRQRLTALGQVQIDKYSWDRMARETIKLYNL